jgi:hypothetical protein
MFYWKYFDLDPTEVTKIQELYKKILPKNNHFFQQLDLKITHFLGLEVHRFVLIQVEPKAIGRIHTDYSPGSYKRQLALQIPLENCEPTTTYIWESSETPPTQYTSNGQPYNHFNPDTCKVVTSFNLTSPLFFRTDLPHSVDNPTDKIRKAISIRFKQDPWVLIGETDE